MTMIWTMIRALHAAAAVKAATGLHLQVKDGSPVHDKLNDALDLHEKVNDGSAFYDNLTTGAGSVAALDPRVRRTDGTTVHVTQAGEYLMIGIPRNEFSEEEKGAWDNPSRAQLMVQAEFQKQDENNACEDLMIKSVTIQGHVLGTNITKLTFGVTNNNFPNPIHSSSYMDLRVTQKREGQENEMVFTDNPTPTELRTIPSNLLKPFDHFGLYAVYCTVQLPTGFIKQPTVHSNKFRTPLRIITCKPNYGQHEIKIVYNSAWRGIANNRAVLQNDLSLYITNVGTEPAGIMGVDNVSEQIKAVPGCKKAQPVGGPFQYVMEGGVRRDPKWKHHRHRR